MMATKKAQGLKVEVPRTSKSRKIEKKGGPENKEEIDGKKGAKREALEPQKHAFRARGASKSAKRTESEKRPKKHSKSLPKETKNYEKAVSDRAQKWVEQLERKRNEN